MKQMAENNRREAERQKQLDFLKGIAKRLDGDFTDSLDDVLNSGRNRKTLKGLSPDNARLAAAYALAGWRFNASGQVFTADEVFALIPGPGLIRVGIGAIARPVVPAIAAEIQISKRIFGQAAQHADDAIAAGKPSLLTLDRINAAANRKAAIGGLDKVAGKHLDEYPPAMFKEGGAGASVRPIDPASNMSLGAYIGNRCRGLCDGSTVRIEITE